MNQPIDYICYGENCNAVLTGAGRVLGLCPDCQRKHDDFDDPVSVYAAQAMRKVRAYKIGRRQEPRQLEMFSEEESEK
jgi:hypothetical protein